MRTAPVPESIINYPDVGKVFLEFNNSGVCSTTEVAPMDIADVRAVLLSKVHNFPQDAMKVFGPNRQVIEVRAWVAANRDGQYLEKWRQNSTWFGADGIHYSMSGSRCTLEFMAVVPIFGPTVLATALRALVPGLIIDLEIRESAL